jgi:hypothetical protein
MPVVAGDVKVKPMHEIKGIAVAKRIYIDSSVFNRAFPYTAVGACVAKRIYIDTSAFIRVPKNIVMAIESIS